MEINCPEPHCRESVLKCINNKVAKSTIMWGVAAFLTAIGIVSGLVYNAYSRNSEILEKNLNSRIEVMSESNDWRYATKGECGRLKGEVAGVKKDIEHIKSTTDRLERQNNLILETLRDK